MAKTLDNWLEEDVEDMAELPIEDMSSAYFFRDPTRGLFIDSSHFYSPADGIILYQKEIIQPTEPIVEIKGVNYTVQDVLGDPTYDQPSLVIGIFMSFYDVHINRIPYGGVLSYKALPPIEASNKPMLALEKDILNGIINPNSMEYLHFNERVLNTVNVPTLDYEYYIVQVADADVGLIIPFVPDQSVPFSQNWRFSQIRWGSQVDLILPIDERLKFKMLLPDHMHVEAGVDRLVKIENIDDLKD